MILVFHGDGGYSNIMYLFYGMIGVCQDIHYPTHIIKYELSPHGHSINIYEQAVSSAPGLLI